MKFNGHRFDAIDPVSNKNVECFPGRNGDYIFKNSATGATIRPGNIAQSLKDELIVAHAEVKALYAAKKAETFPDFKAMDYNDQAYAYSVVMHELGYLPEDEFRANERGHFSARIQAGAEEEERQRDEN